MEGLLGLLFFVGVPGYFIFRFISKRSRAKEIEAMPERPFKIDVTLEPIDDKGLIKVVRGRALTHILSVRADISPKDWDRIKRAGLYDAVLFEYPDPTSTYSSEMREYNVRDLERPSGAPFYNITQAEAAKEKLIAGIHNLKDAIELHRDGKRTESFEL